MTGHMMLQRHKSTISRISGVPWRKSEGIQGWNRMQAVLFIVRMFYKALPDALTCYMLESFNHNDFCSSCAALNVCLSLQLRKAA